MLKFMRGALLATLLCAGCGELKDLPTAPGGGPPPDPSATFSRVQSEIFTPTCAQIGCHDALGRQGGLELTAGVAHAQLVNQPSTEISTQIRVLPGDPLNSYLYRKIVGGPNIVGERMPAASPPLSEAQIALVRDWIRRGAPND
jgi:hypothetical protein